jgi:hypothetical protein
MIPNRGSSKAGVNASLSCYQNCLVSSIIKDNADYFSRTVPTDVACFYTLQRIMQLFFTLNLDMLVIPLMPCDQFH